MSELKRVVTGCIRCPRLTSYREGVISKPLFADQIYWRKPITGWGDPNGWLLILGLAPASHGGNRTGRIFTGDETSQFLYKALYQEGFANQDFSHSVDDGLQVQGCYLTAAVKCAPPKDKPTKEELVNCSGFLCSELDLLTNVKSILVLGRFAFDALFFVKEKKGLHFKHGEEYVIEGLPKVYASYHPSPRNTKTGKLTMEMFLKVLQKIKRDHSK